MTGFAIGCTRGTFLDRDRVWKHSKPELAWVFSVEETLKIFAEALAKNWADLPDRIIRAEWTREKGVRTLGQPKRVELKLVDV